MRFFLAHGWETVNIHTRSRLITPIRYHNPMPQFPPGQTLLIDADDTLW